MVGSLRLRLYVEPESKQRRVELAAPIFEANWQNGLARAAANTCLEILGGKETLPGLEALANKIEDALSRYLGSILASVQANIACSEGCDHCCHQIVGATLPEVLAIYGTIRALPEEERQHRISKIRQSADRSEGLSPTQRYSKEHPCPLLAEARCSVYSVRPLSCRGVHSFNSDACSLVLHDPAARRHFQEEGEGIPSYREPGLAVHAMSAGLQLGVSEVYGLDMSPVDLTLALAWLLSHPSAGSEWLAGHPLPAQLRAGHHSADPKRAHVTGEQSPK